MRKILVGSNIGWSKEIINNGVDGFTVDPKNHKKFCEVLLNIFEDTKEMKNVSASARVKVVRNFDSTIISKKNYNFFHSII